MANPPSSKVRAELESAIAQNRLVLGEVYRLLRKDLGNAEIAQRLGRSTPGFVSNNRAIVRALVEGVMPGGASYAQQVASAVRRIGATNGLSLAAHDHVEAVLRELDEVAGEPPKPRAAPVDVCSAPGRISGNLRIQVDQELRARVSALVERIRQDAGVDADDYFGVSTGRFALDVVRDIVIRNQTGRTSTALIAVGRPDLTVEQAVLDWQADLPFETDLVDVARGRLAYWSST